MGKNEKIAGPSFPDTFPYSHSFTNLIIKSKGAWRRAPRKDLTRLFCFLQYLVGFRNKFI